MVLEQLIEKDVFKSSLDASKELFSSESFSLALSAMKEAIELRRFVAIVGETGSGKTNLLRNILDLTERDKTKIICTLQ